MLENNRQLDLAEFLQSSEWGRFQESTGKKVVNFVIDDIQIQGLEHSLSFLGKYLYIPRLKTSDLRLKNVIEYLKSSDYIFLRIEPIEEFSILNFKFSMIKNRQPQTTLILDLTKSEEQLLQAMHTKTRYNIHLAEKHNVEVKNEKDVNVFWNLNLETTERDKFKSHDKDYYKKMLDSGMAFQLTAYYNDKAIASNIFINYKNTFTYLHGASSGEFRNLMAPYLLQWEGIKFAKSQGCDYYDFWGIAPQVKENDKKSRSCFHNLCWEVNHKWTGVTRFKAGFGGQVKEYPEGVDIILNKNKYKIYKIIRFFWL
ncbi:MAG: peptidoglycan bridge formation glycyltransferase FemA/FemB family protein [Candidatus Magasanikiibacteriota bacterium]